MAKIDELEVMIRFKSGKYIATIPQLGLFGIGTSMQTALDQLDRKKSSLVADLSEVGLNTDADIVLLGHPSVTGSSQAALEIRRSPLLREAAGFGLKALILVGILSIGFAVGANSVIDNARVSARGLTDQFQQVGGARFWKKLLNDIDKLAESEMPAEQKQHLLAQIKIIVQKWQPFVAEGAKLFVVDQAPDVRSQTK